METFLNGWEVDMTEQLLDGKLNELCLLSAERSKTKGFETTKENLPIKLALVITEISEAIEEDRKVTIGEWLENDNMGNQLTVEQTRNQDKFEEELADAYIRLNDICGSLEIDIEAAVKKKMDYNLTRPFRHNKRY